jgi:arabinogalactan endo-1,4-beta-galactosidase
MPTDSRRLLLIVATLWGAGVAPRAGVADDFIVGADVSMLPEIEKAGGVFRVDGQPRDAIVILRDYGFNLFRVRLFVNPDHDYAKTAGATQDLPCVRTLARRIKAVGGRFLLDLHYADTWADPGHQPKPAGWRSLDFDALVQRVHDYTADVLADLKAAGMSPDLVETGNEITVGMLWPDGKLDGSDAEAKRRQWDRFASLLKAGTRAVREAGPKAPRVVVHVDRGGRAGVPRWFFDNLKRYDVDHDVIGLSFYPHFGESFDDLQKNLADLAGAFAKDILLMETAYPWLDGAGGGNRASLRWPLTPAGQEKFLVDLCGAVRRTPGGRGRGVVYWYPEAIPVPHRRIWNGGSTALFDGEGAPLPALRAFGRQAVGPLKQAP